MRHKSTEYGDVIWEEKNLDWGDRMMVWPPKRQDDDQFRYSRGEAKEGIEVEDA